VAQDIQRVDSRVWGKVRERIEDEILMNHIHDDKSQWCRGAGDTGKSEE
jgi:hypothetical protein